LPFRRHSSSGRSTLYQDCMNIVPRGRCGYASAIVDGRVPKGSHKDDSGKQGTVTFGDGSIAILQVQTLQKTPTYAHLEVLEMRALISGFFLFNNGVIVERLVRTVAIASLYFGPS
jgi:hypothetical protein